MQGGSFQMQILFNIFPRISLHCELVPVQYWEYEYGLLFPLALVGYEMIIANSALRASLAICHLQRALVE